MMSYTSPSRCKKILKTRVWPNKETGKQWDTDVTDGDGREILMVSQFTLYGRTKKSKPDFSHAMPPQEAREFYQAFVENVRQEYIAEKVKDGVFGAMMDVSLTNDGPVTFVIDSEVDEPKA
uniref:D-aminoacyl-tRNA deacylase n=1 Tax=Dunaliella tertiolecta TaxID=3047 RepID=A0A7S3VKV7_DUNTE